MPDLCQEDSLSISPSDIEKTAYEIGPTIQSESSAIKNISENSAEVVQETFPTEESAPSEEQYIPATPNIDTTLLQASPTGIQEKIARRNLDAVFSVLDDTAAMETFNNGYEPKTPTSATYLAVHPEEWRALFADAEGRRHFLQILDERRGRSSSLHPNGFKALTTAMQVFLSINIFIVSV